MYLKRPQKPFFYIASFFKSMLPTKTRFTLFQPCKHPPRPIYPQNRLYTANSKNKTFGSYHPPVKSYGPIHKFRPKFEDEEIGIGDHKNPLFSKLQYFQRNPRCALESLRYPVFGKVWVVGSIPTRFDRRSRFSNVSKKSGRPPPW